MKLTPNLLSALVGIVLAGSSYAGIDASGACKKVDFAELKTYSKKEMTALYCHNEAFRKLNSDTGDGYAKLADQARQNELAALRIGAASTASRAAAQAKEISDKADAENAKASACQYENERIIRILKSEPKC